MMHTAAPGGPVPDAKAEPTTGAECQVTGVLRPQAGASRNAALTARRRANLENGRLFMHHKAAPYPSHPQFDPIIVVNRKSSDAANTAKAQKPRVSAATTPRLQDTVRLSADGLAKVLGDLEARVMTAVWVLAQPAAARAVHSEVIRSHPVALLTVVTVLNKLVGKRMLTRKTRAGLLHFEAVMSEPAFMAHASRRVVEGILSFGPDAVAASLVDVLAERDPKQLAELARLIQQRMKR